jgi:hypothetical protein
MKFTIKTLLLILFTTMNFSWINVVHAESVLEYLTLHPAPSLEENVAFMDKDKNGFADVFEVRAFLQAQYGMDYQKEILDKWEASASGKSCSTPFAKELYVNKSD